MSKLRIWFAIATVGRAPLLCKTLAWLKEQTRQADGVMVVGASPEDVEGASRVSEKIEVALAEKGLAKQRNKALEFLSDRADLIAFIDDDFLPAPNYLAELESLFVERQNVAGANGRLIADGIRGEGIDFETAIKLIKTDQPPYKDTEVIMRALYGCNMTIRVAAAAGLTFDERLPLYGWQEDIDFTFQLGRRGSLIKTSRVAGVHLGAKGGRTSGKRFGYSQISNPLYLLRKKTIPRKHAWSLITCNLGSNVLKSFWPEPYVDRRGRLHGNLLAIADIARGRLDPERILHL